MITNVNPTDIAEKGKKFYREHLQAAIEAQHHGEYLVVDVDSGDYSLASDEESALEQIEERRPDGRFYLLRVGYAASLFLGASS